MYPESGNFTRFWKHFLLFQYKLIHCIPVLVLANSESKFITEETSLSDGIWYSFGQGPCLAHKVSVTSHHKSKLALINQFHAWSFSHA